MSDEDRGRNGAGDETVEGSTASERDGVDDSPAAEPPDDDGTEGQSTERRESPRASEASVRVGPDGRDVIVPLRLYKTVTVFSTLIAIVSILAGFIVLDRATQRATVAPEDVNLILAVLGIGLIVGGSAVYAFSTRFRTEGMGKSKDDSDEGAHNG